MLFTPLAQAIDRRKLLPQGAGLLLALSGGLDSTVLGHLLARLARARAYKLALGHVNHGLRGAESDADEAFVRGLAAEAGLPFYTARLPPETFSGQNIQAAARRARYALLEEWRLAGGLDYILTAHHADDAAETLLINLLRGAGPEGLGSLAWANGRRLRPLLGFSRAELSAYAAQHALSWREDASNAHDDYLRNRLRHRVLPLLQEEQPQAAANLARAAARLREADEALRAAAEHILGGLEGLQTRGPGLAFPRRAFGSFPLGLRVALYRALLRRLLGPDLCGLYEVHWLQIDRALQAPLAPAPLFLPRGVQLVVREAEALLVPLSEPEE